MKTKTKNIIGWVLSGLVALMLGASAIDKISGTEHALQVCVSFGLSIRAYAILGIVELISLLLFLYPQAGILGTVLLASYLGGAIATHLQHRQDIFFPIAIEAIVWITAVTRFPELIERLLNKRPLKKAVQ